MKKRIHLRLREGIKLDNRDLHVTELEHPDLPNVTLVVSLEFAANLITNAYENVGGQVTVVLKED